MKKGRAGVRTLLVALLAFALLAFAWLAPDNPVGHLIEELDRVATALRFTVRGPEEPDARVKVVGITEHTIGAFEGIGEYYPLPRYWHAYAIKRLADAGARVIVIDILFGEKDSFDESEDAELRDAIVYAQQRGCDVVLAGGIEYLDLAQHVPTKTLLTAADVIMEAAPIVGLSNAQQGYRDREVISLGIPLGEGGEDVVYHTQSVAALKALYERDGLDFPEALERVDPQRQGEFRINYAGRPELFEGYTYSYERLFEDELMNEAEFGSISAVEAERLRTIFLDTVVFIGSRANADKDTFSTPVGTMFGVDTNAQAFNTLLTGRPILEVSKGQVLLITALLALLAWAIALLRPLIRSILLGLLVIAIIVTANVYLFVYLQRDFSPTMGLAGFLLPYLGCALYAGLLEEAERRRTRSIFSSFLPKEIVDQIIDNPQFATQGVRVDVAVMFNDIRNYSTIAESLTPQQIVAFLRTYFNEVSEVINDNRGGVGKFMGDGMMAWFGGPTPTQDPAGDSIRAAISIVHGLRERVHPQLRALEVPAFQVGIGIHMGSVVMGEVGNEKRRDYTVIGDSVNVASRVEGLTKELGWAILVTKEVLAAAHSEFDSEFVGEHHVKGRQQPVEVYRIVDPKAPELFRLEPAGEPAAQPREVAD